MDRLEEAARHVLERDEAHLAESLKVLSEDLMQREPAIFQRRALLKGLITSLLVLYKGTRDDGEEELVENCLLFLCSKDSSKMRVWMRELVFASIFQELTRGRGEDESEAEGDRRITKNLSLFSDLVQYNMLYMAIATDLGVYGVLNTVLEDLEARDINEERESALCLIECTVSDLLADDASSHAKFVESGLFQKLVHRLAEASGMHREVAVSILNDTIDNVCDEYVKMLVGQGLLDVMLKLIEDLLCNVLGNGEAHGVEEEAGERDPLQDKDTEILTTLVETLHGLMKYDRESNAGALLKEFRDKEGEQLVEKLKTVPDEDLQEEVDKFERVFIRGEAQSSTSEEEEEEEEEDPFGDIPVPDADDVGRYFDGPCNRDDEDYDLDSLDEEHQTQTASQEQQQQQGSNNAEDKNAEDDDLYW